jgi:hypothetical protein
MHSILGDPFGSFSKSPGRHLTTTSTKSGILAILLAALPLFLELASYLFMSK